jgi:two-component system phosphate regulon sensor histidine kinase PhoR
MLVSDDGMVIYANVAAANLLGGRNPVGGSFIAAVRDHEASDSLFECLLDGTEFRRNIEIPGEDRVVEAILARVSSDPAEAVVVMRDVTELARLQTLRRDFVANVSHELRTPLSTVKILTETIIDLETNQPDQLRFLQKIDAEVDSMSALVEDLLQLTQLESGRTPIRRSRIDAGDLINDVEERMKPIAERHQVSLSSELRGDSIRLNVDERRVKQALVNLINNAIVHTPPGGKVEIQAETCGSKVRFSVVDTGVGIPAEDLDRIWERFYRSTVHERTLGRGSDWQSSSTLPRLTVDRSTLRANSDVDQYSRSCCRSTLIRPKPGRARPSPDVR